MNSYPIPTLPSRGLYGVTDDGLVPDNQLLTIVEPALQAGLAILQYRRKSSMTPNLELLRSLVQLCERYQAPLLINDNIELCLAAGAHGVHLGQNDTNLVDARSELGNQAIIGITCHDNIDAAELAQANSADYVAFGRFFASQTKPQASPASISLLNLAKQRMQIPIVAIGGIDATNGRQLLDAGADILAVVHSLFGNSKVEENTKALTALF